MNLLLCKIECSNSHAFPAQPQIISEAKSKKPILKTAQQSHLLSKLKENEY